MASMARLEAFARGAICALQAQCKLVMFSPRESGGGQQDRVRISTFFQHDNYTATAALQINQKNTGRRLEDAMALEDSLEDPVH